jgi:hypothetical protein
VIGVDIRAELLEVAGGEADPECISPWFAEEDPRYLDYEAEFDVVLSLGGGAFEQRRTASTAPAAVAAFDQMLRRVGEVRILRAERLPFGREGGEIGPPVALGF